MRASSPIVVIPGASAPEPPRAPPRDSVVDCPPPRSVPSRVPGPPPSSRTAAAASCASICPTVAAASSDAVPNTVARDDLGTIPSIPAFAARGGVTRDDVVQCRMAVMDQDTGEESVIPGWKIPHSSDPHRCYFTPLRGVVNWIPVSLAAIMTLPRQATGYPTEQYLADVANARWLIPLIVAVICVAVTIVVKYIMRLHDRIASMSPR